MSVKNKVTLLLVIVLLLAGCASKPQAPQVQDIQIVQAKERSISAYGYGEVKVRPDLVRFIVLVKTEKGELSPALEENEKATQDILTILQKYEIANNDIKQDYLQQEENGSDSDPYFYIIQRNIKVVVRDLTKLESLFTEILQAKVYLISDVRFQVSNITLYQEQALTLAVSDARNKAETMATELGREVGEAVTVSEASYNNQNEYAYNSQRSWDSQVRAVDLPVLVSQSFNELEIRSEVLIEFELK